jgi:hypothetical protein
VIGLELGSVWRRLGAKVTVVEYAPSILPGNDDELVREADKILRKQGLEIHVGTKVVGADVRGDVSPFMSRGTAHVVGSMATMCSCRWVANPRCTVSTPLHSAWHSARAVKSRWMTNSARTSERVRHRRRGWREVAGAQGRGGRCGRR